ncbi:protein of unknown function [Thermosyntropha lipolytica DSM 11003]|uniref:DUF4491 domain-containing protein n=1 Tax=Thermosyntropha lipolytica DSM 11003 TaxID=1123382 RepID=A0A1M5NDA9_9FIRM|nr:DUF4491 family protein [Thermosyntropha lipolytica]SHG87467.1 protein of unknown function [Thermosyntropha lipolytica DSM 11003]
MNLTGILFGLLVFLTIGIYHVLVVKIEYHLGTWPWILFLLLGLVCIYLSLVSTDETCSIFWGYFGFINLWTIRELFEQRRRVKKGWYPSKD